MTTDSTREAVALDVRHAEQSLAAARALRDLGMLNDALSRSYYAAFHVACALLVTEGVEPRRHRALPGLILSHLGTAGFDASDAARLGRLATYRDMADYERAFVATVEIVEDAIRDAALFLEKALACLRARGMLEASGPGT